MQEDALHKLCWRRHKMQQEAISSMRMCLNISGTLAMHLSATECRVCRSAEMAGSWLRWRKWWRGQVEVEVEENWDGGCAFGEGENHRAQEPYDVKWHRASCSTCSYFKDLSFGKWRQFLFPEIFFMHADYCIVGGEGRKDCPMDSVQIANSIIKRWVFVKL